MRNALGRAGLLLALLGLACGGEPPAPSAPEFSASTGAPAPRLVVLFATCTLNRSFLGPYNDAVAYTPHLDAFAAEATVFQHHRTEAGMSGIAFASIMTGRQAPGHGVYTQPVRMDPSVLDITQVFARNGYEAWYFTGHGNASPDLNYAKGVPKERRVRWGNESERAAALASILERLKDDDAPPAFFQTAFSETHGTYSTESLEDFCNAYPDQCAVREETPPRRFDELFRLYQKNKRFLGRDFDAATREFGLSEADVGQLNAVLELVYKSNVWRLDRIFGDFIEAIRREGLLDRALIAFTSDHGEVLYSGSAPFQYSHMMMLHRDVLTVPLLLRFPEGVQAMPVFEGVTRSIDLLPTLAATAGLQLPHDSGVTGVDLTPTIVGAAPRPDLSAFSHSGILPDRMTRQGNRGYPPNMRSHFPGASAAHIWVALQRGETVVKYRRMPDGEFHFLAFDLASDPGETADRFDPALPLHADMAVALEVYRSHLIDRSIEWNREAPAEGGLTEEQVEKKLRSLGYIE